jgi:hypothetical protein
MAVEQQRAPVVFERPRELERAVALAPIMSVLARVRLRLRGVR